MKIVIDIPDQMYQKIKETNMVISGRRSGKTFDYILFNAINTGTPLPKGHGRLIDADLIAKQYGLDDATKYGNKNAKQQDFSYSTMMMYEIADMIDDAPTIIEADGGDTETWNGYHGHVTSPKGTFKRIYADADGGDGE